MLLKIFSFQKNKNLPNKTVSIANELERGKTSHRNGGKDRSNTERKC